MDEKEQVINAIKGLKDGENNTARELREVLMKLLNYTENEEQGETNLNPFHFFINQPIESTNDRVLLLYSFKGIKGETVNFTFHLEVRASFGGKFTFRLDSDLIDVLKEIIQTQAISFVVPISRTNPNGGVSIQEHTLFLTLKGPTLIMQFANGFKLNAQDKVFTSIHLHTPSNFQIV